MGSVGDLEVSSEQEAEIKQRMPAHLQYRFIESSKES